MLNMAQRDKIKTHFQENKNVYIAVGVTAVVAVAGTLIFVKFKNDHVAVTQQAAQKALVNWKPTIHQEQIVQVVIPPRGNAGNAIQCDQTGTIFPSQNLAAKDMGLSAGNLSSHLTGKNDSVDGWTFTKLTENGVPLAA